MVLGVWLMSYFCICWESRIHEIWLILKRSSHFGHLLDVYFMVAYCMGVTRFLFYNKRFRPLGTTLRAHLLKLLKGFCLNLSVGFFVVFMAKLWGEKCDGVNYLRNVEEYFI